MSCVTSQNSRALTHRGQYHRGSSELQRAQFDRLSAGETGARTRLYAPHSWPAWTHFLSGAPPSAEPGRPARPRSSSKLTGHLLTSLPRSGTMFAGSWSGSMWRATWILYFSLHILSAQAQGKKDTLQMSAPRCASRLRSAVPADGGYVCASGR